MQRLVLILLMALSGPALSQSAQTALSADAFEAYTEGKTLYFGSGGTAYGVERYLKNRRVIWSFLDGKCQDGIWYEDGGQICFLYEDRTDPQCWTFYQGPGGLIARFENNPEATELYEAQDMDEEMLCYGPEVGV